MIDNGSVDSESKSQELIEVFVNLIDEEIDWCDKNPNVDLNDEFQKGFVYGLRQAQSLYKQMVDVFDDIIEDIISDAFDNEVEYE